MPLSSLDVSPADFPSRRRRLTLSAGSGILLGLSFPPFPFAPLAWVALVPLLTLWAEHPSARAVFVDSWVTFLVAFAVAFQWPLLHAHGQTALLSLPGLLVIPLWMAVPFGVSAAVLRRSADGGDPSAFRGAGLRTGPAGAALLVALYLVMEWTLRRGPLAFPWTLLGHSQSELFPVNQLARYGGVPLLTLLVLTVNLLGLSVLRSRLREGVVLSAVLVAAAGIAFLPAKVEPVGEPVRLGIVQPAVSAGEWADLENGARVHLLLALSDTLAAEAPEIDLVVWPETALPPGDSAARGLVRRWTARHAAPLLTGSIETDLPAAAAADDERYYYNAAVLTRPGGAESVYLKRRLVPFAEHVPFQDRWPWVRRLAVPSGGVPGYARGTSGELMHISGRPFGVLICFESLFDDFGRDYARAGAGWLLTITQDGWWGPTFGYRQHLAFNRLRAIETGLPLVQVSVSGYSAVITPEGAIRDRIGWMERRAAAVAVQPARAATLFVRLGDWVSPLAAVAAFIILLTSLLPRPR